MLLKAFDKNLWYSIDIEKTEWIDKHTEQKEDVIYFELNNVRDDIPKHAIIPNETAFVMSIEDAKYLKAFLEVALNGL